MDKMLFVVESNCADPLKEDEFNEWYNKTHLPDMLETPGVVRAVRYQRIDPSEGQAKYLALYEIETDDFQALAKAAGENMEKKKAEGRDSDLLQGTSSGTFKQIYSLSK
jgi:hypothetical protein